MEQARDASLREIRDLIMALPPWGERPAMPGERPFGLLGALADWAAAGQGRPRLTLGRPRVAVFWGRWADGPDADGGPSLDDLQSGEGRLNALCQAKDTELRVYEMAVDAGSALEHRECATAMAYGMTAVEDGLDLLCLAAVGAGRAKAAAGLAAAAVGSDPLAGLAQQGGHALSALAGAVIAARMARVPVLLDGFAALAAAGVLHGINSSALDHCVLAQPAMGPDAAALQRRLGKEAVLDLGIGGEDGSAAVLVLGLLRDAVAAGDAAG